MSVFEVFGERWHAPLNSFMLSGLNRMKNVIDNEKKMYRSCGLRFQLQIPQKFAVQAAEAFIDTNEEQVEQTLI